MAPSGAELSVLLTGKTGIARLNQKHRKKSGPTDVLSFPLEEELAGSLARNASVPYARHQSRLRQELRRRMKGTPLPLGDVAICVPIAREQAKELGETLEEALARLLAHGIAHLLGYDHERGKTWERAQWRFEEGLLRAARLAPKK
ncbi:MAG: rRNA maturation RNase YbeY [Bdellovibrionota bacterium]